MQEKKVFEMPLNGGKLIAEVGSLADQASGSCLVQFGQTTTLVTAQLGESRPEMGYFPLSCEFEEKHYAAGKILGSRFVRREGRPSIDATLSARMIDRTIRPLFPEGLTNEIQVIAACLSWDTENDPDVFAIIGASLALLVSEIPWAGPVGAVRVSQVDGKLKINPTYEERATSPLDLILVGQEKQSKGGVGQVGDILINMLDGKADQVSNELLTEAFDFAVPYIKQLIDWQKEIAKKIGKTKAVLAMPSIEKNFETAVLKIIGQKLSKAIYLRDKQESKLALKDLTEEIKSHVVADFGPERIKDGLLVLERETDKIVKENILKEEKRPDGRKIDEVREIETEVALFPRTHGSGLFRRGQTKVLSIVTLGSPGDQLMQESMEFSGKKRFMLHYNFPPYSVGEVKRMGSPGRRELGHGALAEKTIDSLLPNFDDFPYTIRVVSEVVSSNGSSSMASASSACLALMDAGVPIKAAVAGISIGLVKGDGQYKLLSDIQGPEDHYGEMDFKASGTAQGITALQMDVKGDGISKEIFIEALERAKKARLEILAVQNKTLAEPRAELSPFAPRIYILQIDPKKIGMVIGPGGKMINEIIDTCSVTIDIEDTGQVFISADKEENAQKALAWIKGITKEVKVGELIEGQVKTITDFGAFVEVAPGQDGLVHVSQLAPFRVERVEDVVSEGDIIPVKVIGIDPSGKISLSAKDAGFNPKVKPSGGPRPAESRRPQRRPSGGGQKRGFNPFGRR